MRPVIGICSALERARFGAWDEIAALLPFSYVRAVQRAGGVGLLLAPDGAVAEDPALVLDRIDGLMLAGGVDVDPATYGAARSEHTVGSVPERDRFEIALVLAAIERDLPVLAICRGMQVLNVACGGSLHQHVPELAGSVHHRRNSGTFEGNDHLVDLDEGSLAARAAGETTHVALSHHHQGVDRVGAGLTVTGHDRDDRLVEALERRDRRFVLGVQWHPEADPASQVIGALVEAAGAAPA